MRPTVREKLAAIKHGVELPVNPRELHNPGTYLDTDERAVHQLARAYQWAEDHDYVSISWANQERAAAFFNANGLSNTLTLAFQLMPEEI